jgi:ParB family chromosome partitioning protein
MTMNTHTDLVRIPLHQLALSPRNARKTGGQDIDGLAASIAAHGLLQNLTVTYGTDDGGSDRYEVIAGGRRLAALRQLASNRLIGTDFDVPCRVIADDDVALEASTAENTLREAMHPADQFIAFQGMVEARKSIPDVAAHFGVPEIVVKQRLKLANVDPKLVEVYRTGGMQLDQLQALALTDDHAAQRDAWFKPKDSWERTADRIRDRLTKSEVRSDSLLARFVGVDAYEAAGGPVRRDLFSTRDEAFLGDKALLDKLAMDKLEALAAREREAGWAWVETHLSLDYGKRAEYPQSNVEPKFQKPTEVDKQRIALIDVRLKEIEKDLGALEESSTFDDAFDALETEETALQAERSELKAGRELWPAETVAKTGVLIYLDQYDGVQFARGRLQPGQKVAASGAIEGKPKAKAEDKPKKATLSDNFVRRLTSHRTLALQESLAARPDVALQLLVTHLLARTLLSGTGTLLEINPHNVFNGLDGKSQGAADLGTSPARKALLDLIKGWQAKGMPKSGAYQSLAEWVAMRSQAEQLELLALATACTLNAVTGGDGRNTSANAIAALVGLDMAQWWEPNADTFLAHVSKPLIQEAVADVDGKPAAEKLATLKRDPLIAEAAKHLAGKGWLPKPLRGPDYALKKPVAPAVKKPVKKAAAKAPAKKAAKGKKAPA